MAHERVAVVGSGPTAFASCLALVAGGIRPVVLDTGLRAESASHRVALPPAAGLPEKTVRGSDHPYRIPPGRTWNAAEGVGILPSFAAGGHSTVWGASMLPYGATEMVDWPIAPSALAPHYQSILAAIPFAAGSDRLEERFPLFARGTTQMPQSERAAALLRRADDSPPNARIIIGRARLALDARPASVGGCSRCGLCMYGCPDHLIFDAGARVLQMAREGLIDYRPGTVVTQWRRSEGALVLDLESPGGDRQPSVAVDRVLLAAGVLSTAEIVARSLRLWDQPIRILDSQYFVGPLLSFRPERSTHIVTLAQAFIELHYGPNEWAWAHCQVYPPNHFSEAALRTRMPPVPGRTWLAHQVSKRVFPVQGFLPSQDSGFLELRVHASSSRGPTISAHGSPRSNPAIRQCMDMLNGLRRILGGVLVRGAVEVADVGRSFHIGGSFPMQETPRAGTFATDASGQLSGHPGVHLVDASTLPSIAGTTITLTAMANAHRIATLVGKSAR